MHAKLVLRKRKCSRRMQPKNEMDKKEQIITSKVAVRIFFKEIILYTKRTCLPMKTKPKEKQWANCATSVMYPIASQKVLEVTHLEPETLNLKP